MFSKLLTVLLFLLSVYLKSAFSSGTIKIVDADDSKLYNGPKNPRRWGLSSYILRASSTTQPRYFTGSPKPVWDDPGPITKPFQSPKFHTIECSPGLPCSSTIPLYDYGNDNIEDEYNPEHNMIYDRIDHYNDKVTFRPTIRSTTTPRPTSTSTLGLSYASGYDYPRVNPWPRITDRPTITRRPTLYQYHETYQQPEVVQQPLYSNYERYDPFAFHYSKKRNKRKRPTVTRVPQLQKRYDPKPSHYMDSRFGVQSSYQPKVQTFDHSYEPRVQTLDHSYEPRVQTLDHAQRPNHNGPFRSSLTWKNGQKVENHSVNKRLGYNMAHRDGYRDQPLYLSNPVKTNKKYFPQKSDTNYYESNRSSGPTNRPRRNYFPVAEEFQQQETEMYGNNDKQSSFIGEEQVVNAGYTVQDTGVEPNDYLISSYEYDSPDLSQWYDLTSTPTPTTPYPRYQRDSSTLKPWTSIDLAKPTWEEDPNNENQKVKNVNNDESTYGSWTRDTLKIGAVPFSRATDGKERKWIKVSSVKRKRKRIPPNAKYVYADANLGVETTN